jgi:glycosyltransferase involved in cell wall biosynthesis
VKNPKISVIMPAYNHEKFVGEAIESVLKQSFTDFEFIIINDGSTDGTDAVIRKYDDPRISYYVQENQDAYNALNRGLSLAKGKYIAIINSDDVYHPERLAFLADAIVKNDAIFLMTNISLIGEDSTLIEDTSHFWNVWFNKLLSVYEETGSLEQTFFSGNLAATTSNLFFARRVMDEVGMFSPYRYAHDYDFAIRALLRYHDRFMFLKDEKLLYYRMHSKNTITGVSNEVNAQIYHILDNAIRELYRGKTNPRSFEAAVNALSRVYETASRQVSDRDSLLEHKDRVIVEKDIHVNNIESALKEKNALLKELTAKLAERDQKLADCDQKLADCDEKLAERESALKIKDETIKEKDLIIYDKERNRQIMLNSISWRITAPLRYLHGIVYPKINALRTLFEPKDLKKDEFGFEAHKVQIMNPVQANRPRILHALANFMTGGSSRLVVDLIEHLGHQYEQEVITSHSPNPPCYTGLVLHELKSGKRIADYFHEFQPVLVHVHYWGECDKEWYEQVFSAAGKYGCKIIENINTPVEPFFSEQVDSYVYVSDYVLKKYRRNGDKSLTIHPGSNFNIFTRQDDIANIPDDCIGMVYRLEPDKLNEQSIDAFIKVAQRRPETKVVIVGGGTFLEPYRNAAITSGVMNSFTFTGYVSYQDLPKLYEQMSIFVAPVWKESFGQVSPFAMNMGIPVVGYDTGALSEIIGDQTLLAPQGDSDRLAEIIIDLLGNREKRLSIGRTNRDRAQALFSDEMMVKKYKELYEKLIKGRS